MSQLPRVTLDLLARVHRNYSIHLALLLTYVIFLYDLKGYILWTLLHFFFKKRENLTFWHYDKNEFRFTQMNVSVLRHVLNYVLFCITEYNRMSKQLSLIDGIKSYASNLEFIKWPCTKKIIVINSKYSCCQRLSLKSCWNS